MTPLQILGKKTVKRLGFLHNSVAQFVLLSLSGPTHNPCRIYEEKPFW